MLRTPPVETSGAQSGRDFAAIVSAYILIFIVLCPGTRFIATPVNHDDFSNLGHAAYKWYAWRPVSYAVLLTLSQLGVSVYYAALHVLVIVYAFLSMRVLRRLLDIRSVPVIALLPIAAAMLGYEYTIEYSRYTGLITNLLSGVFAFCAMALMAARAGAAPRPLSFSAMAIVWLFSALSFWSKEDFLLPVVMLAGYFGWQTYSGGPRESARPWLILLAGLAIEVALLILYNNQVQSVFTQSTSGGYKPDFTPLSILRTARTYVLITPGARMAFLLAASSLALNRFSPHAIPWSRLCAFLAMSGAIALPYLCLPNHVFPYYGLNWTVWESGGGLLALWRLYPGRRAVAAIAILAVGCLVVTQRGRTAISLWYSQRAETNRNILQSLAAHRSRLEPYPAVAVEGAPLHGPWFGTTGEFLKNRLQLDHVWLVRVPKNGEYWQASWNLLGTDVLGDIKTVAAETEPLSPDMPLVKVSRDGTVTVDYPPR